MSHTWSIGCDCLSATPNFNTSAKLIELGVFKSKLAVVAILNRVASKQYVVLDVHLLFI